MKPQKVGFKVGNPQGVDFKLQNKVGFVKDVTHSKFNDQPNSVFKAVPEILET